MLVKKAVIQNIIETTQKEIQAFPASDEKTLVLNHINLTLMKLSNMGDRLEVDQVNHIASFVESSLQNSGNLSRHLESIAYRIKNTLNAPLQSHISITNSKVGDKPIPNLKVTETEDKNKYDPLLDRILHNQFMQQKSHEKNAKITKDLREKHMHELLDQFQNLYKPTDGSKQKEKKEDQQEQHSSSGPKTEL